MYESGPPNLKLDRMSPSPCLELELDGPLFKNDVRRRVFTSRFQQPDRTRFSRGKTQFVVKCAQSFLVALFNDEWDSISTGKARGE
jgi:hypothetical protein